MHINLNLSSKKPPFVWFVATQGVHGVIWFNTIKKGGIIITITVAYKDQMFK
jgi:hypothetical protein